MNITEFDIFNIQQFIDRFDKLSETNFKEDTQMIVGWIKMIF